MIAQPDPNTVRNVAFLLSSMSIEDASESMRKVLRAIRSGMVEHFGWRQVDADEFACRFGDAVVAQVREMPRDGSIH
jgi:hypothetical protein